MACFEKLTAAMVLVGAVAVAGCADQQMGEVQGTVTFEGQPVSGAMVLFEPHEQGRPSLAVTDAQGRYQLTFSATQQGATTGKHLVRITTAQDAAFNDSGKVVVAALNEKIPADYNTQSTLEVTVEPGANQIDFDIPGSKP